MKVEHYLAAVSKAIDAHEATVSEAFEHHSQAVRDMLTTDEHIRGTLDAIFMAELGRSYLAMMDTINNLRKWPRT